MFSNPNGPDVAYDLWAYTVLFKGLTGSAHWWVMRNRFQMPVEIWPIPSHWMRLETDGEGQPLSWAVQSPWGPVMHIPYEDVVNFWEHSPLNRYEGYGVSLAINEWIDAYESNVRARLAQYNNGAIPAFHVALGESYSDPDEAFLARFYSKWFQRFQGPDNTGRPLITGADVEVKSLGITPVDMRYVENEDQFAKIILAAYGVPRAVACMSEDQTYGAVRATLESFHILAINPELSYMGQVITEKVVRPTPGCEDGVCFWDERAFAAPDQVLQEVNARFATASITPNEIRAMLGAEPYEHGGDDPLLNGSPVPWATGKQPEGEGAEAGGLQGAMQQALGKDVPLTTPLDMLDEEGGGVLREHSMGEAYGAFGGYGVPVEQPVSKEQEPEPAVTYQTDTIWDRDRDGWFVEVWRRPGGDQVYRTRIYSHKGDAEAKARRWITRHTEEPAPVSKSLTGGFKVGTRVRRILGDHTQHDYDLADRRGDGTVESITEKPGLTWGHWDAKVRWDNGDVTEQRLLQLKSVPVSKSGLSKAAGWRRGYGMSAYQKVINGQLYSIDKVELEGDRTRRGTYPMRVIYNVYCGEADGVHPLDSFSTLAAAQDYAERLGAGGNKCLAKPRRKQLEPKRPFTVAVDLDGTLADYDGWPRGIGEPLPGAREAMQDFRDLGFTIIVWTCRSDRRQIVEWLRGHGIPFDHVNENPDQSADTSDKVQADCYLDDHGLRFEGDWQESLDRVKVLAAQAAARKIKRLRTNGRR